MGASSSLNPKEVDFSCQQTPKAIAVTWKVKEFSSLKEESKKYLSPEFRFQGNTWNLQLYPNGVSKSETGKIGLFLQNTSLFKSNKYEWIISLQDEKDNVLKKILSKDNSKLSDPDESGRTWGSSNVVDREEILKKNLPDDVLTIHCEIISVGDDEISEDSGKVSSCVISACDCSMAKDYFSVCFSKRHSDVTLKVGRTSIPAHKVVLSSRSQVFSAMFDTMMKESQENIVNLSEIEVSVAKSMLQYIYSGKAEVSSMDNTIGLYKAADRYCLVELKEYCRNFISENLTIHEIGNIAAAAYLHSDDVLMNAVKDYFAENMKDIIKTENWLALSKQNPKFFLDLMNNAILQ